MPGILTNSMQSDRTGIGASAPPAPTFLEGVGASVNRAVDDIGAFQDVRLHKAYNELEDTLVSSGQSRDRYRTPFWQRVMGESSDLYDKDAMWADIAAARARDAKAFSGLPADRAGFERYVLNRKGNNQRDAATAQQAGFAAQLTGGIIGGFADPLNLATLPIGGGGRTILQTAAREGAINALVEAIQQPFLAENMERRGEKLTAGQAGFNVLAAGAGGYVLGGAIHAGAPIAANAREAALAKIYPMLPESVRARFGGIDEVPDSALADLLEDTLGKDNLTPDEVAALHVMRREDEIAATNPFVKNGAGIEAHADGLRTAMERILADVPPSRPIAMPGLRGSTAISSGTVDLSPRSVVKQRIGVVESDGSNSARNPRSSALGIYQFTSGTWKALYERRFGKGLAADAVAAKRSDPRLQDILMDDLMAANGAALRRGGQAETPGNLYLAHFAGSDGALRLLQADPAARAADILGDAAARANPWMQGKSAADMIAWANRKMGQDYPSPRAGERVEIAGGDPEAALQRTLQEQLDALEGQRLALEQGGDRPDVIDPEDAEIVPVDLGDDLPLPITPRARPVRTAPMDVLQFIANRGGIADVEGHDLRGMLDGNPFIPGMGTLLRDKGQSLDRIREAVVEAGYFGDPRRTDVTIADVIDLIDRQHRGGERQFVPKDVAEVEARRQRIQASEDYAEFDARLRDAASDRGIDMMDDEDAMRAFELWDGDSFEGTLDRVIAERLSEARMDYLAEVDPTMYAQMRQIEELGYGARRPDDGSDPGWVEEPGADTANPRENGKGAGDGGSPAALSRATDNGDADPGLILTDAEQAHWDEPDGAGPQAQVDSLTHDFEAALKPTVLQDAAGDDGLGPSSILSFLPAKGRPGVSVLFDGDHATSVFRDVEGKAQAAVQYPVSQEARAQLAEVLSYVRPEYRRQGIGTQLYDALIAAGHRVDELSGTGDLTPDGAAFVNARRKGRSDPAMGERQRQEAKLRAEAPLQGSAVTGQAQDGTMGLGLFDAVDQRGFRLEDEGDVVAPGDLLAQLDAEEAAIKGIEDCL